MCVWMCVQIHVCIIEGQRLTLGVILEVPSILMCGVYAYGGSMYVCIMYVHVGVNTYVYMCTQKPKVNLGYNSSEAVCLVP